MLKTDLPIVKLFFYKNKYFIYDAVLNKVAQIDRNSFFAIREISQYGFKNSSLDSRRQVEFLFHKGFLRAGMIQEIEHPSIDLIEPCISRGLKSLTLEITQKCNFKCRYCDFANENLITRTHTNKTLDNEIAYKAIHFYKTNSVDSTNINISFYGGEPLLEFHKIQSIIDYANVIFSVKNITYNMTTNGSLLLPDVVDYLVKKNVYLLISLDGPENIQNKNRRFIKDGQNTFSTVIKNINYLKNNYKKYFQKNVMFNAVLLDIADMEESKNFFHNYFELEESKVRINMANKEHLEYYNFYLDTQEDKQYINSKLYDDFCKILEGNTIISPKCHHRGPCIPGGEKLFVDVHGNFFPCEKVNHINPSYKIGNVYDGFDYKAIKKLLNIGKLTEFECKSCWAINFCMICCQMCDDGISLSADKKKVHCNYTKEQALKCLHAFIDQKIGDGSI